MPSSRSHALPVPLWGPAMSRGTGALDKDTHTHTHRGALHHAFGRSSGFESDQGAGRELPVRVRITVRMIRVRVG